MNLQWRNRSGNGADYYNVDTGVRVGCINMDNMGNCIALSRNEDGSWTQIGDSKTLYYIEAKRLVEVTARIGV